MQTILVPVRWEPPPPPPCVKCGTTTAIDPVFEQGQRTFVVRCPACRHVHTYSLDYECIIVTHGERDSVLVVGNPVPEA